MTAHAVRPCRHVLPGPPAAARAVARPGVHPARAGLSRPAELRGRAARGRHRGGRRRPALPAAAGPGEPVWSYGDLARTAEPDRRRADRGPRRGAGQPGAAARARTTRGWWPAGSACCSPAVWPSPRCRCCARPSSPRSATSPRSARAVRRQVHRRAGRGRGARTAHASAYDGARRPEIWRARQPQRARRPQAGHVRRRHRRPPTTSR